MKWQDRVFFVGGLYFAAALTPLIADPDAYVPLYTSITTAAFLFLYAAAFYSRRNLWPAVGTAASAVAWTLIAFLRGTPP